ncbi:unnamed protein product [Peniophora sp. CBMAI 1063]|nr:unnamed protein product [Peniophora sp. CBMAI 1063]
MAALAFRLLFEALVLLVFSTVFANVVQVWLHGRAKVRALRGVSGPPSNGFFFGNLRQLLFSFGCGPAYNAVAEYGGIVKVEGLFGDFALLISDHRAIAQILLKDFDNFPVTDMGGSLDLNTYFLGAGLLSLNGAPHRYHRKALNPGFSPKHMRRLGELVRDICCQIRDILVVKARRGAWESGSRTAEFDVGEVMNRAGVEIVSQASFGYSFRTLEKEDPEQTEIVRAVKEMLPVLEILGPWVPMFMITGATKLPHRLIRLLGKTLGLVCPPVRKLMRAVDVLHGQARVMWEKRKADFAAGEDPDENCELLSTILWQGYSEGGLTDEEVCAQMSTVLFAGSDTTSTTLSRALHMLALNPHCQDRLREELERAEVVQELLHGVADEPVYNAIDALPYLDAVCRETIRECTPLPFRNRRAQRDCVVPLKDGSSVLIPGGSEILINVHGCNRDEDLWGPDAHLWRPERWLEEESLVRVKEAALPAVYMNSMSFLGGRKACIGFKFALLEMKTVLATVIPSVRFLPPEKQEIAWRFGPGVTVSTTDKFDDPLPRMPLRVEAL